MENDFMKRGYLLPTGCKDLFDALKHKAKRTRTPKPKTPPLGWPSEVLVELEVPDELSVTQLAGLLGENPPEIVFDLIKLGIYVTLSQQLDFETISLVIQKYGFQAKKMR